MFLDDIVAKINEDEAKTESEAKEKVADSEKTNEDSKKRRDGLLTYCDEFYKAFGK